MPADRNPIEHHEAMLKSHHDRLLQVEKRLGIAHKPDDMASEDQTKPKDKQPHYGRKRH